MNDYKKNIFRRALDSRVNPIQKSGKKENAGKPAKPTFIEHREMQINKDYVYLQQRAENRTTVEEICFKYKIERPISFVGMMNFRYLEPPNFEKLGYIPNAEKELSHLVGEITDSTNEKVLYLEAVIKEAENELYHDLQNKQFKKVIQSANEMLQFLNDGSQVQEKKASQSEPAVNLKATENKWPDPYKECFNYYPETKARVKGFEGKELEIIAPVMKETLSYIDRLNEINKGKGEPRIESIDGHVQAIRERCDNIPAGKDAKNGFINFIAKKAGLKLSPINEERFSKI